MNKSKSLVIAGLLFAVTGVAVLLDFVFEGEKTSAIIRNSAFSFVIVGSLLSMYGKKLADTKANGNK